MNIVTGHKGFVGVNLTSFLKKIGKSILGVSRTPRGGEVSYQELNTALFNKAKSIIHLAGKAHDLKKTSEDSEYYEVNTELTKKLFDKFLQSKCEVFVYMSSVKAAADTVEGILKENVIPNPKTVYGKSKLMAEQYILSKKIPQNKRVYILRPCMIHGPHNKGNLNLLYSFVSKGIPYPFGSYKNKRSFLSVENLCFVINEIIDNSSINSGIYNIADDTSLSTKKLVQIIGETIEKPVKTLNIPKVFINIIAKIGNYIPIPINSERVQKLTENYEVSNEKIKKELQKELPLTAEEGIKKTITSF